MPRVQKLIGERVSTIPTPNILFIDSLALQPPALFDSNDLGSGAIQFRHSVSPNLLFALTKFSTPAIYEALRPDHLGFMPALVVDPVTFRGGTIKIQCSVSSDLLPALTQLQHPGQFEVKVSIATASSSYSFPLALDVSVIRPEEFLFLVEIFSLGNVLERSTTVTNNLLEPFNTTRIIGMNYRDRIWREVHPANEREVTQHKQKHTKPLSKAYLEMGQIEAGSKHRAKPRPPSLWDLLYAVLQPPLTLEPSDPLLSHDLYPYQPQGIHFLLQNDSALLADEMGTGKTVMTTVALKVLFQKGLAHRALIVCPLSVLRVWNRHLEDWAPELRVTFVRGNHSTRSMDWKMPAHVYVTTYDTLRSDIDREILPSDQLNKFDVVVLDEAQNIKNRASGRTKAIKRLKARQRWALTGTPVENKIEDVVSLFEFLRPGYLSPFDLYGERIKEKIKPYFLRRRKQDVLRDLPEMIKQEVWLELDPNQRIAYDAALGKARDDLLDLLALGARVTKMDIMTRLQRLKQICNFAPGKATSPKLDYLKEQLEEIIESDQKVIVFSQYIGEGIDKLSQVLEPYGVAQIIGSQSESVRNDQIQKFKVNRETPILLASVKAGGVGLTLTEASYAVHFDHWWNPAVMWQAEARIHRPGQKGVLQKGENDKYVVNVYSYWMSDTIEERIYDALKQKGLLFADIVDGLAESQIDELFSIEEQLDWFDLPIKKQAQPEAQRQDFRHFSLEAIREKLYEITPMAFENLAKELLRSLGFPTVKVTGQSHDGGIDVIAVRDTADGIYRAVAQCKRYRGTVGVEIARELMGVIAADKGIKKAFLITTGDFSLECLRFCEKVGVIVPIYGLQVANYIKQFGLTV